MTEAVNPENIRTDEFPFDLEKVQEIKREGDMRTIAQEEIAKLEPRFAQIAQNINILDARSQQLAMKVKELEVTIREVAVSVKEFGLAIREASSK